MHIQKSSKLFKIVDVDQNIININNNIKIVLELNYLFKEGFITCKVFYSVDQVIKQTDNELLE